VHLLDLFEEAMVLAEVDARAGTVSHFCTRGETPMCCPACPTTGASSAAATGTAANGKKAQKAADAPAFGNLLAEQLQNRQPLKLNAADRVGPTLNKR